MKDKVIGFIGGGNMASSLLNGLISSGHDPNNLWVSDVDTSKLNALKSRLGIQVSFENEPLISASQVVVFAIKPQVFKEVAQQASPAIQQQQCLVISIAAGITQSSLTKWLGDTTAIVRCMPNTPALVQTGATGLHSNSLVTSTQRDLAENILRSVGITVWVDQERDLDAITAVSGSGPAYFFLLMEALEATALELGLNQQTARLLIQQTALGAAKIAMESIDSPADLRKHVTSPGGTTEQAVNVLQQGALETLISKALHAARDRSVTLSQQLGE